MPKLIKVSSFCPSAPTAMLLVGSFVASLLLLAASPAHAQSTISAIPPRLEVTLNPGETKEFELKVRNESETTQTYTVRVQDVIVTDDIGTPTPVTEDVSGRWSSASWISAPRLIPVDAKSAYSYNIRITAPTNALPGGHYAMLTYQPNAHLLPAELQKTGSLIGQRTGTIIYITIPGAITENALIRQFQAPTFNEFGPVPFTGSIENLSDIHVNPTGAISIFNIFGRRVASIDVSSGNIFPGASRRFEVAWDRKWGIGPYRAQINLIYGPSSKILTESLNFWLFPIRLIIAVLVVIILILVAAVLVKKRLIVKEKQLEKEVEELKRQVESSHHHSQEPPISPGEPTHTV